MCRRRPLTEMTNDLVVRVGPSRRVLLAALLAAPTAAVAGAVWTTLPLADGRRLYRAGPARGRTAFVFFPGANCDARRYGWLSAMASARVSVYLLAPAPQPRFTLCGTADVLAALDAVRPHHRRLLAGGHSAGAAALLDSLDPASAITPRKDQPQGYTPPQDVTGLVVMGCSLQPQMLEMVLPGRSEDQPLSRPNDAPMLFLSGDHDRVATPELMRKTRERFRSPAELVVIAGGGHYGWVEGREPADRLDFDQPGTMAPSEQQRITIATLSTWAGWR